jgi:hypothetical protein
MKEIKLTQGKVVLVDDWNYDWLNQWKWRAFCSRGVWYAVRSLPRVKGISRKQLFMHRLIMNTPDNLIVDHIDHNGLNCLEENMRNCTSTQNKANRRSSGIVPYLGVTTHTNGKYVAKISILGKTKYLGVFSIPELAANRYDEEAKKQHGEFANLNF